MLSKSIGLNLKINNIGQSQIKNSIANVTNITNFIILNIYSFSYKHYCQFFTGVKFVMYFNLLKTQMPQIRVVGKKKKKMVWPRSACNSNSHLEVSQNDRTALCLVSYTTSIPRDSFVLLRCHMSEQQPLVVCTN